MNPISNFCADLKILLCYEKRNIQFEFNIQTQIVHNAGFYYTRDGLRVYVQFYYIYKNTKSNYSHSYSNIRE